MVPACRIHSSDLLPVRSHGTIIEESVKHMGVLQPLIVRPLDVCLGEYELIDGQGRLESLEGNQLVPVEIVEVGDNEVFKISHATFQRKNRTTYEKAEFFHRWLQTVIQKYGAKEGAQAELAKQAGCTEGLVSQYLAIYQLFEKLKTLDPNLDFSGLKMWDLNRLYQFSRLVENPNLLEIALELENKPDTTLDELKIFVSKQTTLATSPQTTDSMQDVIDSLDLIPSDPTPSQGLACDMQRTYTEAAKRKLTNLVAETTQNLPVVTQKLANLMQELKTDTEKHASKETIKTVKLVSKQIMKLHASAEALDKIAHRT
jgi:ParB/Sulfiredoxin domain